MPDSDCNSLSKRDADISDKWMTLKLPNTFLNPRDDSSRVTLREDLLCVKLLSGKGDTGPGSMKLRSWDRRLKKMGATSHHQSPIRAANNKISSTPSIPDTAIKVNLDKFRG